jgi:integrase
VLNSIDTNHVVGYRDKALLATLAYTFARIGAVVNLKVEEEILDEYLKVSKLREKPDTPLFPTTVG